MTQRHNKIRDVLGDIAALACKEMIREPVIREANDQQGVSALIADFGVRGVWQPQTEALLNIHVTDTDAWSYIQRSIDAILNSAEEEEVLSSGGSTTRIFFPICDNLSMGYWRVKQVSL